MLKVNAEAVAGWILTATSAESLSHVVEAHLDHEPGSPYRLGHILDHLVLAGLSDAGPLGSERLLRTAARPGRSVS